MSDTTTTLNAGSGGDVMDESLITQPTDGVTLAKRPRVVIAGNAAGAAIVDPVAADPGKNPYSIPALGVALVDESPPGNYTRDELRPLSLTSEGRLRVSMVPAALYPDYFGDETISWFASSPITGRNPWKDIL